MRSGHTKNPISHYIDKEFNKFKNSSQRDYQNLLSAHENLQHRFEKLKTKIKQYDAGKISITVDEETSSQDGIDSTSSIDDKSLNIHQLKKIFNNLSADTRVQFLSLFSWDDVYEVVDNLCAKDLSLRDEKYYRLLHAQTLPDIMSCSNPSDVDFFCRLLYTPYYEQCRIISAELHRQRIELKKETKFQSEKNSSGLIRLIPSLWIRSFLKVFDQKQPIVTPVYPTPKNMKDIFYSVHIGYENSASSAQDLVTYPIALKDYAADIHYHLARFLSVLSSALFLPLPDNREQFPETSFTDIQLLIHYSVLFAESQYKLNGNKPISYRDFVLNEPNIVLDFPLIISLVIAGIESLLNTISDTSRFREYHREYVQFTEMKISGESCVLEPSSVPPVPMNIFRSLIIENIHLYKSRLRTDIPELNNNWMLADHSPIGQLINHDRTAIGEFNKMYKLFGPDVRNVSGNMYIEANKFLTMHRLYSYLLQCSLAITLAAGQSNTLQSSVRHVLERGVRSNGSFVTYASTGDILPGLYFESILGVGVDSDKLNMESKEYYSCAPYRAKFFDLFGMYCSLVPSLSSKRENLELPREISAKDLTKLRLSNREAISVVRAAMLNCFIALKYKRTKVKTEIRDYFKTGNTSPNSIPLESPVQLEINYNGPNGQLTFYSNPCIYHIRRGYIIKKTNAVHVPDIEISNLPSYISKSGGQNVAVINSMGSNSPSQTLSIPTLSHVPL